MLTRIHHRRPDRSAYTLLELVFASAITASVLVSTLALLRDSVSTSLSIERSNAMSTLCASKLEQSLATVAATFTATNTTGDFATAGYPELRFIVTSSDDPTQGGITGELMAITTTVWHDEDGDTLLDAGEPSVVFGTKLAKMQEYIDVAQSP